MVPILLEYRCYPQGRNAGRRQRSVALGQPVLYRQWQEQGSLTVDWVEAAHWPWHSRPPELITTVYRTISPDGAPKSDRQYSVPT